MKGTGYETTQTRVRAAVTTWANSTETESILSEGLFQSCRQRGGGEQQVSHRHLLCRPSSPHKPAADIKKDKDPVGK